MYDKAINSLNLYLELEPESALNDWVHYHLALCYSWVHNYKDAQRHIKMELSHKPDDPKSLILKAHILLKTDKGDTEVEVLCSWVILIMC